MKKIYSKRDGATAALRKAGIKPEDYDKHLAKVATGFEATLPDVAGKAKVAKALKGLKASVDKQSKKAAKPKAEPRETVAGFIRDLIKKGKKNEEIWKLVKPKFKLSDDKKHYPGWYRGQMNRTEK